MKVVSTDGLTKLIQLIKSSFISNTETEQTMEIDTSVVSEVTLATVATTGDYDDLTNKPDLTAYALDANVVHLAGAETITGSKTFSSVAYGTASDADGSIVTTVNKSKAANGYFKLGNGLIVQWGFLNGGTSTSGTINFPTAFSSVNFRVVAVSNSRGVDVSISQESTTGCNWAKTSTDAYIKWIAIGY